MIAKRVMRANAGKFRRLGAYILNPEKLAAPSSTAEQSEWRRTADYILDIAGGGARSQAVRITNCASTELEFAIREIELTQEGNQRARGSRTYHLVVSFPPGERPEQRQLIDIEDELCAAIGLGAHQRISAVHTDTEHLHIHIAINQIHTETGACVEPWYDKYKLMRACARLEVKHGLQRTFHGARAANQSKRAGAAAMERHGGRRSLHDWIKNEVQPNIGAALRAAKSWQDVHALFAEYSLEIKPRGAGLVIKPVRGRTRVKASDIDRALASKAMTARFGAFVAPDPAVNWPEPKKTYRKGPVHKGDDVDRLWRDYQEARQAALWRRQETVAAVADDAAQRQSQLQLWYAKRRRSIVGDYGLTRTGKEGEFIKLDAEYAQDRARLDREAKERRRAARQANHIPTWVGFLRERSESGDAAARSGLQRQEKKFLTAIEARLNGNGDADTAEQMLQELKPEARADGAMVYRLRDGGVLSSTGDRTRMEKVSPFSVTFFLHLHQQDSPGKPLMLEGDDPTIAPMIRAAVAYGIDVAFATPAHEAERQRLIGLVAADADGRTALVYAVEYQATRWGEGTWAPCALWEPEHAGVVSLEGIVTLKTGTCAARLRRDDVMLVKPLGADEIAAFEALKGQRIVVDREGGIARDPASGERTNQAAEDTRNRVLFKTVRRLFGR